MVKFKEFCCGCNLRQGTLIILWSTLVTDGFRILLYISKLLYSRGYSLYGDSSVISTISDLIFLIACAAGLAISAIGIFGIQKNRAEFLKLSYYYYLGYMVYWIFIVVIIIIFPSWYDYVTIFSPFYFFAQYQEVEDNKFWFAVGHLFLLALTWYFTTTIESHLDDMAKNEANNFNREIPDPEAYDNSASP